MGTCQGMLGELEERRRWVGAAAEAAEAAKKEAEKSVEDAKKSLKSESDLQACALPKQHSMLACLLLLACMQSLLDRS